MKHAHDAIATARENANRACPAIGGLLDARSWLESFGLYCVQNGVVPFLGTVDTMTDEEVDRLVTKYRL